MAKNEVRWLMVALTATPILFLACGGDDTSAGGTTGAAGAMGAGGTGSGTGGSTGTGGATTDSGVPDGRIACGTVPNGCNPNRNPVCDLANNRCVQCLSDTNCTMVAGAPICNTATTRCVQCLETSQCPTGMICSAGNDCVSTCTTDANCAGPDGGASANPRCNTTATPMICVECLTETDCAPFSGPDAGFQRPFCNATSSQCVQCRTNDDCMAGQVCNMNGFCGGGGDGGQFDGARGGG